MNKNFLISLLIVALFALGVYLVVKNAPEREVVSSNQYSTQNMDTQNIDTQNNEANMMPPEMVVKKEGTGTQTSKAGDRLGVVYTGYLQSGEVFDSNVDAGQNFEFTLGAGEVISGWDIGLAGMKVGEIRVLSLPPAFAYGSNAVGPIPANSTLIFEVELKEIK